MNNVAVDISIEISVPVLAFNSFGYTSRNGIARSYGNSMFNFFVELSAILFSTVAVPWYTPKSHAQEF